MSFVYREAAVDVYRVDLSGPLNVGRFEDLVELFQDLSARGIQRVVVNLENVPFIDSQGLAALIAGYKIFGSDSWNFRLAGIQDQPRLVFELTGFDQVFGTDTGPNHDKSEPVSRKPFLRAAAGHQSYICVPQLAVPN